jgi:hypothetical protein
MNISTKQESKLSKNAYVKHVVQLRLHLSVLNSGEENFLERMRNKSVKIIALKLAVK